MRVRAYSGIPKLELEVGMGGMGGEGLEGLFRHANDHGSLRQGLGSIPLASRTLERDGVIDGNGERHKRGIW